MAGEVLHEDASILGPEILDRHRAISTVMEELEAIDWYDQRIKASSNAQLRAILTHNRNEETEHASMILEWLRRHDPEFDKHMRRFLFTSGPIHDIAEAAEGDDSMPPLPQERNGAAASNGASGDGSLGIGSLRGAAQGGR
ncbi:MAG: ferritin [Rhodospirillales bacterium]|nr:ferritin [Rhodospirillales bacterium]